jgi:hypothetical protein
LRDSKTIIDGLEGLMEHFADEVHPSVCEAVRRELVAPREQLQQEQIDLPQRRRQLQQRAFREGRRLFCENPKPFTNRCTRYWDEWRG